MLDLSSSGCHSHLISGSCLGGFSHFCFLSSVPFLCVNFSHGKGLMIKDTVTGVMGQNLMKTEVKWVSPSGIPTSYGVSSTAEFFEDIRNVLAGDVKPLETISLRDPVIPSR